MSRYSELTAALANCQANSVDLLAQNEYLRARLETLRRENSQLRRQLREKCRETQILRRALDAAQFMAMCHMAGQSASRDACVADGMPQRAWYWGRALLMDARLHNGRGLTTANMDEINEGIRRAVSRYQVQGFYTLRGRNPRLTWDRLSPPRPR